MSQSIGFTTKYEDSFAVDNGRVLQSASGALSGGFDEAPLSGEKVELVEVTEPHLSITATEDVHIIVQDVGCVELALGRHVIALDGLPINLHT